MMKCGLWTGFGLTIEDDSADPLTRLEHTFDILNKAGFTVCELDERNAWNIFLSDEFAAERNRKFIKDMYSMVQITQMHAPKPDWDIPEQQRRIEILAQACRKFDIGVLVIHPYPTFPNAIQESLSWAEAYRDLFNHTMQMLRLCSRICNENGVQLAIENQIDAKGFGGRWPGGHPADIEILLQEIPSLKVNIDTAHACAQQLDVPALIHHFSSKIQGLHISDSTGETKDLHIGLGKGIIDWKKTLAALHSTGYSGDFHLELVHERETKLQKAEEKAKMIYQEVTALLKEFNAENT
jgi:sugar phosphate isomerase/epimerase